MLMRSWIACPFGCVELVMGLWGNKVCEMLFDKPGVQLVWRKAFVLQNRL